MEDNACFSCSRLGATVRARLSALLEVVICDVCADRVRAHQSTETEVK